jgi:hypothetical protein
LTEEPGRNIVEDIEKILPESRLASVSNQYAAMKNADNYSSVFALNRRQHSFRNKAQNFKQCLINYTITAIQIIGGS